tara:strand:- start:366 stop:692 length:327 start_codon:yes stop_codon:yes gene_type:complete
MSYFKKFNVADAYKGLRYDMKKKQWVKSYAGGGRIPGSGPRLSIVHGGEVVLNKTQQKAIISAKTVKGARNALKLVQRKKPTTTKAKAKRTVAQALKLPQKKSSQMKR